MKDQNHIKLNANWFQRGLNWFLENNASEKCWGMSIETDIFTTSIAEWGREFLLWNNFTDIYITKWDENCSLLSTEKSFVWLLYKYLNSFFISDF